MRLLLDQNLSPRLPDMLADVFPGAMHVSQVGLDEESDRAVWEYAREHDLTIVTKDADFGEMSVMRGFPPRVIWIRRGNCSTRDIENLLRENSDAVYSLAADTSTGILVLM